MCLNNDSDDYTESLDAWIYFQEFLAICKQNLFLKTT